MKTDRVIQMRPSAYAEHRLVTALLDGTYPPGSTLPNERSLATKLGVTRPTLREVLQRLSREGWIKIQHGKPSQVRDYWAKGGLSLLGTLADHAQYIPENAILHLLEIRLLFIPTAAARAAIEAPEEIAACFKKGLGLSDTARAYAAFDWQWQVLATQRSGNPFFPLILNDFSAVFRKAGVRYFSEPAARTASRSFYRQFHEAITGGEADHNKLVETAMRQSIQIWQELER
ncbi:MAG: GntR family transcriptional regulator [Desulfobacterales bacterium]|nr:GntR family transcriptional regulator [Desulfobacterales bacterium]